MFYRGFLGIVVAPSNSGKTTYVLDEIKYAPPPQHRIWFYTFDEEEEEEAPPSPASSGASSVASSSARDPEEDEVSLEEEEDRDESAPVGRDDEDADSGIWEVSSANRPSGFERKSYRSFSAEAIPAQTFVILDEVNDALQKYPRIIEQIENLFTTRAHHHGLSVVCLCQTVLKTPMYQLLRLAHAVILQTQQGSNVELARHLLLFKPNEVRQFLVAFQDQPRFVTIYVNPPFKYQLLGGTLYFREGDVRVLLSMSGKDLTRLSPQALNVLRPLFEKNLINGLAILPLNQIEQSPPEKESPPTSPRDAKLRKRMKKQEEVGRRKSILEENVFSMINWTAPLNQRGRYRALWYFIRNESSFAIDENTLLLTCGRYQMGLQPFMHALLMPGQLRASSNPAGRKRKRKEAFTDDLVYLTSTLMRNPSFNQAKIANTPLKQAAKRLIDASSSPWSSDEEEEEETEVEYLTDSSDDENLSSLI